MYVNHQQAHDTVSPAGSGLVFPKIFIMCLSAVQSLKEVPFSVASSCGLQCPCTYQPSISCKKKKDWNRNTVALLCSFGIQDVVLCLNFPKYIYFGVHFNTLFPSLAILCCQVFVKRGLLIPEVNPLRICALFLFGPLSRFRSSSLAGRDTGMRTKQTLASHT